MRLMKYSFTIKHVPGKQLITVDALSRAPPRKPVSKEDERLGQDLNLYVAHILESLPAERTLEELKLHQQNDEVCRKLFEFCAEAWPDKSKLKNIAKYWPERASITVQRGLLMTDQRTHPIVSALGYPKQDS